MEIPLIKDLVIVLGLAVLVILLFLRFKIPTVVGFLITGTIAGPHGLSLVQASEEVHIIAEIGVILLLFIIGLEFSIRNLLSIKRLVLVGGSLQVGLTIAVVMVAALIFGFKIGTAIFLGFLFSLSSTAIVLKLLQEKGEISSPHGRSALAILIFQDLIVVPMMLVTPMLTGQSTNVGAEILGLLAKGAFVILFVFVSARYVVPWLLFKIAQTRSKELFVLAIVVICFAVAWLTSSLGLSLALGAFMAGLIISESEYSPQATSNILPFREVFTSFFFISIGMLLDLSFLVDHLVVVILITLAAILLKTSLATFAGLLLGFPMRTALLSGLAIFQVGEFAFILSATGLENQLLTPSTYQTFLAVSILSMVATPFALLKSASIVRTTMRLPFPKRWSKRKIRAIHTKSGFEELSDHLIIIGYGVNGKNVALAARKANINYVIIELNPETVRKERRKGERILYGDAVHPHILNHVNIHKARVVVIAISDPIATKLTISSVRGLNTHVHIIVRTRMVTEIEENYRLGANEVVPEEFETSIEIFNRVLAKYLVPADQIIAFTSEIRADNYDFLRSTPKPLTEAGFLPLALGELNMASLRVLNPNANVVGKNILESDLKQCYGITLIALKRGNELYTSITADTVIHADDTLFVLGDSHAITRFHNQIRI